MGGEVIGGKGIRETYVLERKKREWNVPKKKTKEKITNKS